MPVRRTGRKVHGVSEVIATCEDCGAESLPVVGVSPAAPELTGLERLGQDGWRFTVGFYAMLAGHRCWCPACGANPESDPDPDADSMAFMRRD